jgi:hypothetical protein
MRRIVQPSRLLIALVSVGFAAALVVLTFAVVVPALRPHVAYPGALERAAAAHLDKVRVSGFDFVGEEVGKAAVSRFWIRRTASPNAVSAIEYDGRRLNEEYPNGVPLSRSRFEKELGWLALTGPEVPCGLSAYLILEMEPASAAELPDDDKRSVAAGTATLLRVVVTCGQG